MIAALDAASKQKPRPGQPDGHFARVQWDKGFDLDQGVGGVDPPPDDPVTSPIGLDSSGAALDARHAVCRAPERLPLAPQLAFAEVRPDEAVREHYDPMRINAVAAAAAGKLTSKLPALLLIGAPANAYTAQALLLRLLL